MVAIRLSAHAAIHEAIELVGAIVGNSCHYGRMDTSKILAELRLEREQIEQAIMSLERLARGQGKRRGRPPAWLANVAPVKRRGRPPGSKNKIKADAA